jgi:hypothetical protein
MNDPDARAITMKKVGRESEKLETLNLFSLLRSGDSGVLYNPANRQSFLAQVDSGLTRALDSEATLHGIRVQSLFRGMIANLDSIQGHVCPSRLTCP